METSADANRREEPSDASKDKLGDAVRAGDRLSRRVGGPAASGTMWLDFQANGWLETETDFPMARGRKKFRWRWLSFDEATGTARIECQREGETTTHDVVFMDDETIRLVPPNIAVLEIELVFRRAR